MAEKSVYKTWIVPIVVGIAITVISALAIALIFAAWSVFKTQDTNNKKIDSMEIRMEKFEKKQDKILESSHTTNSNVVILTNEIKHLATSVRELKAEVKGSYTTKLECIRAKMSTADENKEIASSFSL